MLAVLAFLVVQELGLVPPTPFDRVIAVRLDEGDRLLDGHGRCEWVDHVAEFSGTLHVWTKADGGLDLFLRVEDKDGKVVAEDDDSGGKPTPYVKLAVEAGRALRVAVALANRGAAAPSNGPDKVELHLVAAPETEATRAVTKRAQDELAEIKRLREARDVEAARSGVEALIERLASDEDAATSEAVCDQAWVAGLEAYQLSLLHPANRAWRMTLLHRSRTLPDDHPGLQSARTNVAFTAGLLGDLPEARALQEKVLEVNTRTLPDDHPELQRARQNLGGTLLDLDDLPGARALQEKVLEVNTRTLPDDHRDLQGARMNLGNTLLKLGDLRGARALQEKVLEVYSRTLDDDHPDLQAARTNLAAALHELGDLRGALALEKKVLEVDLRTLPDDHPSLQDARHNLAATLFSLGDLRGSLVLKEKVLEVRSRTVPDDHPDLQAARVNLAYTLRELGELARARALEEHALQVYSRTLPDDHLDLQLVRQSLAITLEKLGDLQGARVLEERVLEVRSRTLPDDHPHLQTARQNLANTLRNLGNLPGARALEETVLEVSSRTLPDDHPDLALARQNLANTLRRLGDLPGARVLLEKALEIDSRTLPDDHPSLQMARQDLAITLKEFGDLEGARALEEQVLETLSRTMPDDHPSLQIARTNLAGTLAVLGSRASAREKGENEEMRAVLRRRFRQVCSSYLLAGQVANRAAVLGTSPREAEERVALWGRVDVALSMARGLEVFGPDPELAERAFALSESTRNVGLFSARLARGASSSPEWERLRGRVSAASEHLAVLVQHGGLAAEFGQARAELDLAQRELVELGSRIDGAPMAAFDVDAATLARSLNEQDALVGYRRYEHHRIDDQGKEAATTSLCAFALRSDGRLASVELGPIEPIERAVVAWRGALGVERGRGIGVVSGGTAATGELRARGDALRGLIFDPLLPSLTGAARLIVALDDVLNLVPLDALPCAEEGTGLATPRGDVLLGDRWRIELRTALSEVLLRTAPSADRGGLLAIGGADFDREATSDEAGDAATEGGSPLVAIPGAGTRASAGAGILRGGAWEAGFTDLPGTRAEIRSIVDHFGEVFGANAEKHVLERSRASRASLIELAPHARFLHIATHGWFAPESIPSWTDPEPLDERSGLATHTSSEERVRGMSPMLLCGLALAGANLPANAVGRMQGLITAEELSTLDLTGCELAVLSACDTNVGQRRAGQGVASLQKALHIAGARSVITSLWKVPDEATKDLMIDFYRRIWVEKKPKYQALWEAKRNLREATDEEGRRRYSARDWAAWVLTGESD